MDEVFRALSDPTRRALLDELFRHDGQTLSALEQRLPMSRFGVMKHLRLLEEAGLVTTQRRGREKLHFLNPVPIRLIHDRWVSKYAQPWAAALSDMKRTLEETQMVDKVFEVYIRTTPQRLWEAITDREQRLNYTLGSGEYLEQDAPKRLVERIVTDWNEEVRREGPTVVTWEIAPWKGDQCRLTVTHRVSEQADSQIYGGWPIVLSGLKTWLETGEVVDFFPEVARQMVQR